MKIYISRRRKRQEMKTRQNLFEKYIPEVSDGISKISGTPKQKIVKGLEKMLNTGVEENDENEEKEN